MCRVDYFLLIPIFCSLFYTFASIPSLIFVPSNVIISWTNAYGIEFSDGSVARFILLTQGSTIDEIANSQGFGFAFGCGFYCIPGDKDSCYFSVVIVVTRNETIVTEISPQVTWTANGDSPIKQNGRLALSMKGVVLSDADNATIWSRSGQFWMVVAGIGVSKQGNLMIFNRTMGVLWESFSQPTNTLLAGQNLQVGDQLTSSVSSVNLSTGPFYARINSSELVGLVNDDDRSIMYMSYAPNISRNATMPTTRLVSLNLTVDSLDFFYAEPEFLSRVPPPKSLVHFLRLDSDGGIRIYGWKRDTDWTVLHVVLGEGQSECQFPLRCGRYGVCSNGDCSCPVGVDGEKFFEPVNLQFPNLGCQLRNHAPAEEYELVNFGPLSCFSYYDNTSAVPGLKDDKSCKQACLQNTSCKASFFMSDGGLCYLPSEIFSIVKTLPQNFPHYTSLHMKIPLQDSISGSESASDSHFLWGLVLGSGVGLLLLTIIGYFMVRTIKNSRREDLDCLMPGSGHLSRFTYKELCDATGEFSMVIGKGGFGMVFKGILPDGTKVAVKRLEYKGQGLKEFVAEVNTIGNIHHINLVRLIGFCATDNHRMLVYEYMSNGSLDKWIYKDNCTASLDWEIKKKIVLDLAKGLAYLHEECREKIAHLDVKPHNVLLDDKLNAMLSDFGLSKLISRDENEVVTDLRGTLGYIAPEWQHNKITEKADVYSFGVVVLEVLSGRKIFDYCQPDSQINLLHFLQNKCMENKLLDFVDSRCIDAQVNIDDIIEMIKVAMWCLNADYTKRPDMSSVVKILKGTIDLESGIPRNFPSFLSPPRMCFGEVTSI